jgi:hypothetical protein
MQGKPAKLEKVPAEQSMHAKEPALRAGMLSLSLIMTNANNGTSAHAE